MGTGPLARRWWQRTVVRPPRKAARRLLKISQQQQQQHRETQQPHSRGFIRKTKSLPPRRLHPPLPVDAGVPHNGRGTEATASVRGQMDKHTRRDVCRHWNVIQP